MTNGIGAVLGNVIAGQIIAKWFEKDGVRMWNIGDFTNPNLMNIWFIFAAYSLLVAVLFAIFFRHKHDPKQFESVHH